MVFDLKLFGSKLNNYRVQCNMEIKDLAMLSGINIQRLQDLENGLVYPSGDEVLILSDVFICDFRFFISNEVDTAFEKTEALFRTHGDSFSMEDRRAFLEFVFLCECEENLQNCLGKRESFIDFKFKKQGTYFKGHAIQAAIELRHTLKWASNELRFDIFQVIRSLGIHVFRKKLGNSNISGLYINHPKAGKCILVNSDEDCYRQRFTVTHELGHALLDYEKDFVVSFWNWDEKDLVEIRANTFASNFLIPRDFLITINKNIKEWNKDTILEWAEKLKVNTVTLIISLKDENLISKTKADELKNFKLPMETKTDPELLHADSKKQMIRRKFLIERGLTSSYLKLCLDAYQERHISAGRLAEMLLCSEFELHELVGIFGGKLDG